MDLRVKKGTKMSEVYYTFLFFENECEWNVMLKYYEQNLWWFKNFHPEARKQCEIKYLNAKSLHGTKRVNKIAEEFFKEEYK